MKRATSIEELREELQAQTTFTAEQAFTARVLLFIAEKLTSFEVEQIFQIKQQVLEIIKTIATNREEAAKNAAEAQQTAYDLIPKLHDGKLEFETADSEGNIVYAEAQAVEIRRERVGRGT